VPQKSASEKYFEGKLRGQRNRRVGRAVGTTLCCGIPCLFLGLFLAMAVLLGFVLL
jgi:hypothetical protein